MAESLSMSGSHTHLVGHSVVGLSLKSRREQWTSVDPMSLWIRGPSLSHSTLAPHSSQGDFTRTQIISWCFPIQNPLSVSFTSKQMQTPQALCELVPAYLPVWHHLISIPANTLESSLPHSSQGYLHLRSLLLLFPPPGPLYPQISAWPVPLYHELKALMSPPQPRPPTLK